MKGLKKVNRVSKDGFLFTFIRKGEWMKSNIIMIELIFVQKRKG